MGKLINSWLLSQFLLDKYLANPSYMCLNYIVEKIGGIQVAMSSVQSLTEGKKKIGKKIILLVTISTYMYTVHHIGIILLLSVSTDNHPSIRRSSWR